MSLPGVDAKIQYNPNIDPQFQNPNVPIIPESEGEKTKDLDHSGINGTSLIKDKELIDNDEIIIEDKYKPKNENEQIYQGEHKEIENKPSDKLPDDHEQDHEHQQNEENFNNGELPRKISRMEKLAQDKMKVPPRLFKTFIITSVLALLGIVLIILGCIQSVAEHTPGKGIMFWVLGSVVIIPGGFYTYQFIKAKRAKDEYQREDIFDNIPEL